MTQYAIVIDFKSDKDIEIAKSFLGNLGLEYDGHMFTGHHNAVECIVAVQCLIEEHPALMDDIRTIKLLRIEEISDLIPALQGFL